MNKLYKRLMAMFAVLMMGLGTLLAQVTKDDYLNSYLTIESLTDNDTIKLHIPAELTSEQMSWLAYSTDGTNWTTYEIDGTLHKDSLVLNQGEKVYFKGLGKQCDTVINNHWYYICIQGKADHIAYGNIMSLLYGDDFASQTAFPEGSTYAFGYLFNGNKHLVSVENLMLPATTLAYGCYFGLFAHCPSIISPVPELPAAELEERCYMFMFYNCTALPEAPALPATTLALPCYDYMFGNCSSLTEAPALPATVLAELCYACMFFECSSLRSAPELPATTLAPECYTFMFYHCTALTEAPELPATTMVFKCYKGMFDGCTSLTRTPVLTAPVLAFECYAGMFELCSNLQEVTCLATDISATDCVKWWLEGVASSGNFYKAPEMNDWLLNSDSGIPEGWTVANYNGVEEQQDQVVVYPNPVVDQLHITGEDIQSVKVYDMQGRLVHSKECGHVDQVEVDFQGFAKGVYTVSIQTKGRDVTKSVVY